MCLIHDMLYHRGHTLATVVPAQYQQTKMMVQADLERAMSVACSPVMGGLRAPLKVTSQSRRTSSMTPGSCGSTCCRVQTPPMHESHSAQNIASVLTTAVSDWRLCRPTGLQPSVTDNASNVVLAARGALPPTCRLLCAYN